MRAYQAGGGGGANDLSDRRPPAISGLKKDRYCGIMGEEGKTRGDKNRQGARKFRGYSSKVASQGAAKESST
eukprot:749300-Hanusia_phi.AAC.5